MEYFVDVFPLEEQMGGIVASSKLGELFERLNSTPDLKKLLINNHAGHWVVLKEIEELEKLGILDRVGSNECDEKLRATSREIQKHFPSEWQDALKFAHENIDYYISRIPRKVSHSQSSTDSEGGKD